MSVYEGVPGPDLPPCDLCGTGAGRTWTLGSRPSRRKIVYGGARLTVCFDCNEATRRKFTKAMTKDEFEAYIRADRTERLNLSAQVRDRINGKPADVALNLSPEELAARKLHVLDESIAVKRGQVALPLPKRFARNLPALEPTGREITRQARRDYRRAWSGLLVWRDQRMSPGLAATMAGPAVKPVGLWPIGA